MNEIRFSHWGNRDGVDMPSRVLTNRKGFDSPIQRICRSIERRNRGLVVANCQPNMREVDGDGRTLQQQYELTLGRPAKGGGYNVHCRVWVAVHYDPR